MPAIPPAASSVAFKSTSIDGTGTKTTTSSSLTVMDATNLPYLTLDLKVGEVVECVLSCQAYCSDGNPGALGFQVDRPTSADTQIGVNSTFGPAIIGGTSRQNVTVRGIFTATEAGTHGFRPAFSVTNGATITVANATSGNDDTLITFTVKNLGFPAS